MYVEGKMCFTFRFQWVMLEFHINDMNIYTAAKRILYFGFRFEELFAMLCMNVLPRASLIGFKLAMASSLP